MVYLQWEIEEELDKELIDWQQVWQLFIANQALCRVRDEYGMHPLHLTCYTNVPLYAIEFFIRIWCEGMMEVVPILDTCTTSYTAFVFKVMSLSMSCTLYIAVTLKSCGMQP